jgi:FtsH-binding integral membrane protein
MQRLSHDAVIAIVLLLFCGVLFWSSFDIREPDYGVLMPSTWPRVIIGILSFLSVIYLVQSLRQGSEETEPEDTAREPGIRGWVLYWRNPLWCFFLFFLYLLSLPVLGMLIGGITFVFVLQGVLGGWDRKNLVLHAVVAVLAVGGMWSLFTFVLGVLLPPGMILGRF